MGFDFNDSALHLAFVGDKIDAFGGRPFHAEEFRRTVKAISLDVVQSPNLGSATAFKTALYKFAIVDNEERFRRFLGRKNGHCTIGFEEHIFHIKHRENAFLSEEQTKLFHLQAIALEVFEIDNPIFDEKHALSFDEMSQACRAHGKTHEHVEARPHRQSKEDVPHGHVGIVQDTTDQSTNHEGAHGVEGSDLCHLCLAGEAQKYQNANHARDKFESNAEVGSQDFHHNRIVLE